MIKKVRKVPAQSSMPKEACKMLKQYIPIIDEQADNIHKLLEVAKIKKALKLLRLRENTIWALSDFSSISGRDMFNDDTDALESAGKLALYGSMIMLSLNRLPEALAIGNIATSSQFFCLNFELYRVNFGAHW